MKENVLRDIYHYLPAHVPYYDPRFHDTPEIKRLAERCLALQHSHPVWDAFLSDIKMHFHDFVHDWTMLQTLDRCFRFSLEIDNNARSDTLMVIHISFITPHYGIYLWTRRKDTVPVQVELVNEKMVITDKNKVVDFAVEGVNARTLQIIDEKIYAHFQCTLLPPGIAGEIVPNLSLQGKDFGEVTCFMAAFTENIL